MQDLGASYLQQSFTIAIVFQAQQPSASLSEVLFRDLVNGGETLKSQGRGCVSKPSGELWL